MAGRYLSIDFGSKRMGLAISDPEGQIVSPLKVIEAAPTTN
ncbi:MAG: Holliday junction resolvase RuvX [Planctomycetota bacterium]